MCCMLLAENTGCKQYAKIAICAPSLSVVRLYLRKEGMYRQSEKKLVKHQYLLHMSSQYGELGPLMAETGRKVWGTPANFNMFLCLGFVAEPASLDGGQPIIARCLAISRAGTLYIQFLGTLAQCPLTDQ